MITEVVLPVVLKVTRAVKNCELFKCNPAKCHNSIYINREQMLTLIITLLK